MIAGAVVGGVLALCLLGLIWWCCRRRRKRRAEWDRGHFESVDKQRFGGLLGPGRGRGGVQPFEPIGVSANGTAAPPREDAILSSDANIRIDTPMAGRLDSTVTDSPDRSKLKRGPSGVDTVPMPSVPYSDEHHNEQGRSVDYDASVGREKAGFAALDRAPTTSRGPSSPVTSRANHRYAGTSTGHTDHLGDIELRDRTGAASLAALSTQYETLSSSGPGSPRAARVSAWDAGEAPPGYSEIVGQARPSGAPGPSRSET